MSKIQDSFPAKGNDQITLSSFDTGRQISESKSQEIQSPPSLLVSSQKSDLQEKKAQTTTKLQKFFSIFSKTPDPRGPSPSDMYLAEWDPTNLDDSVLSIDEYKTDDIDENGITNSNESGSDEISLENGITNSNESGSNKINLEDGIKADETPSKPVTFPQRFISKFCFCLTKILPFFKNIDCIAKKADKIHAQKIVNNESQSITKQITDITTNPKRQQRIRDDVFTSLFTSSENQQNILSRLTREFKSMPNENYQLMTNAADAFLEWVLGKNFHTNQILDDTYIAEIDSPEEAVQNLSWPEHLHLEFEDTAIRNAFIKCLNEAAKHSTNYYNLEFSIQTSDNGTPTIQVSSK